MGKTHGNRFGKSLPVNPKPEVVKILMPEGQWITRGLESLC